MGLEELLVGVPHLLTAPIQVVQEPSGRWPPPQRLFHKRALHRRHQDPAHNLPGKQI